MICIYYIGLQHPELCGTVPLLFTMSRRPGRCLFILLCAHAHNTKIGGVLSTSCAVLHVYYTVSSGTDFLADTMAQHSDPRRRKDTPGPSKRPKRKCMYQSEWCSHRVYPRRHGPAFVFCELCGIDINVGHGELIVGHGELNDVRKHLATSKHQEVHKAMSGTSSL